eukprot:scaffold12464_cov138-Skeletonema_dohrnii-CCMP3373.AAC.2
MLMMSTEAFFLCFGGLPNIGNRLNSVWRGRKEELKEGRSVTVRTISRQSERQLGQIGKAPTSTGTARIISPYESYVTR